MVDPIRYFEEVHLRESLVLSFAYSRVRAEAELVIDYAAEVVSAWFEAKLKGVSLAEYAGPPRDFRQFNFTGVNELKRDGSAVDEVSLSAVGVPPQVIEWVSFSHNKSKYNCSFQLSNGPTFDFNFREFSARRRLANCETGTELSPRYIDVATGETLDFHNPFPY